MADSRIRVGRFAVELEPVSLQNRHNFLRFSGEHQVEAAVTYRRWSFTRKIGVLDKQSFMGDGRLREVVAHGGSTVLGY